MSELKAFDITVAEEGYCEGIVKYRRAVYDKSEADKVIARHKYKRCLAMAKLCGKTVDHLNSEGYIYEKENHIKELTDCIRGTEFYDKWYNRWLELAEKFKPNKEAK
jgi:hypothetical protein